MNETELKHERECMIWATKDGHEPAWVLPGGIRTTDKHEATAYAVRLNRLLLGR